MRRAATAGLLAATLLLAACTHDDPAPNYSTVPQTSAPPTSSPTPSPSRPFNGSSGETSPTPLAEASDDSPDGALAFALFYVKSIDWVIATGNYRSLEPFYAATCTTCASRIRFYASFFDAGQSYSGGRVQIARQALVDNDGRLGATLAVSTEVSIGQAVVVSGSGASTSTQPSVPSYTLTTWLVFDSTWKIVEELRA